MVAEQPHQASPYRQKGTKGEGLLALQKTTDPSGAAHYSPNSDRQGQADGNPHQSQPGTDQRRQLGVAESKCRFAHQFCANGTERFKTEQGHPCCQQMIEQQFPTHRNPLAKAQHRRGDQPQQQPIAAECFWQPKLI